MEIKNPRFVRGFLIEAFRLSSGLLLATLLLGDLLLCFFLGCHSIPPPFFVRIFFDAKHGARVKNISTLVQNNFFEQESTSLLTTL